MMMEPLMALWRRSLCFCGDVVAYLGWKTWNLKKTFNVGKNCSNSNRNIGTTWNNSQEIAQYLLTNNNGQMKVCLTRLGVGWLLGENWGTLHPRSTRRHQHAVQCTHYTTRAQYITQTYANALRTTQHAQGRIHATSRTQYPRSCATLYATTTIIAVNI